MKGKKQTYWLVFDGRAVESVSVEQRHARFFKRIKALPLPWGLRDRSVPSIPKFKGVSVVLGMTKFFGNGVQRAMMSYRYRHTLADEGLCDDALNVTFNSAKVDLHHLIYTVIPKYIEAFDAYLVEYFDDQFIDLAYEDRQEGAQIAFTATSKEHFNPRFKVKRINVLSFYDEVLCRRGGSRERSSTPICCTTGCIWSARRKCRPSITLRCFAPR